MNSKVVCMAIAAVAVIGAQPLAHAQSAQDLVGHWRKTTISFGEPRDEHLVLRPNGVAERWVVTAKSRTPAMAGQWQSEGKILAVRMQGQNAVVQPYTFHQGQLVFPNIPNRRGFWEKVGR